MILIVLMIIIMMGMGIFLLFSSIRDSSSSEFDNYYTHNLLLTVLRTHTGYKSPCSTVSETISSAFLLPGTTCQGRMKSDILNETIPVLMDAVKKPNLEYYLVIQPENWEVAGGRRLEFGKSWVDNEEDKSVANEKILQYGSNLRVKLVLAEG